MKKKCSTSINSKVSPIIEWKMSHAIYRTVFVLLFVLFNYRVFKRDPLVVQISYII